MEQENYYSGLIVQAASKDKFLEFYDAMEVATPQDYAMIQGRGGKKHAPSSGIRISITDYSDSTKDAKHLGVQVPTYVFDLIKDICMKNNGTQIIRNDEMCLTLTQQKRLYSGFSKLLNGMKTGLGQIINQKPADPLIPIGTAVKESIYPIDGFKEIKSDNAGKKTAVHDEKLQILKMLDIPFTCDYQYNQQRVYSSYPNGDGTVNCSILSVSHRSFMADKSGNLLKDENGEPVAYKLAWSVNISRFKAKPITHANGTVSYDGKTIEERNDLSFSLSNEEMFRCVYAVEHFVQQWERANLSEFIKGKEMRKQNFQNKRRTINEHDE